MSGDIPSGGIWNPRLTEDSHQYLKMPGLLMARWGAAAIWMAFGVQTKIDTIWSDAAVGKSNLWAELRAV